MDQEALISELRELRQRRRVPQKDVARAAGLSVQQVSQVETGVRGTTFEVLQAWAGSFGLHLTYALVPRRYAKIVDLLVKALPAMSKDRLEVLEFELSRLADSRREV